MDLRSLLTALSRVWWLIVAVALLSAAIAWLVLPDATYRATVKATVLVAGDLERPGRSERPELMVLDDLLPLVESPAFAEPVHAALPEPLASELDSRAVQQTLSGSRYSRVLSVTVSDSSEDRAAAIAAAVNRALPGAITTYLVAPGDRVPQVDIIDPGSTVVRQAWRRWLNIGVVAMFATFAAVSLVWLQEATRPEPRSGTFQAPPDESAAKNPSR
jgi:capsular polysaccharide biosynthesis protein